MMTRRSRPNARQNRASRTSGRRGTHRAGAIVAMELLLVLPVMMAIFFGTVEYGLLLAAEARLYNAGDARRSADAKAARQPRGGHGQRSGPGSRARLFAVYRHFDWPSMPGWTDGDAERVNPGHFRVLSPWKFHQGIESSPCVRVPSSV